MIDVCRRRRIWGRKKPAASVAPLEPTTDVFEYRGPSADARGWDYIVFMSVEDTLHALEIDLSDAPYGAAVQVVRRRYTQAEMDEVVYE